ncbi:MAG: DedA family protein [Bacteriovoracaceae bacterium]
METINQFIHMFAQFFDIIMHLDVHLNVWVTSFGPWIYLILFLIIFCETGLIVTPFLPGDSLLFALGALAATDNAYLDLKLLAVVLITAGIIGDAVNYSIGRYLGPKVFKSQSRFLKKEYLDKTQAFYEKHGGRTIILARYLPIVRTFAPFVAGVGAMKYPRFLVYNIVGAVTWVLIFLLLGNYFGNLPSVKSNFHIVIFGIIGVSMLPIAIEFVRNYREKAAKQS